MNITTNIRLPEDQLKALKIKAIEMGTNVSELLRQAVNHILAPASSPLVPQDKKMAHSTNTKTKQKVKKSDAFYSVIGLGEGGPKDDSSNHDRYLYRK